MAKKQSFSHIKAQELLETATSTLNGENLPFILLSTFCGYGEASLQRVRDGRDNKSRDPETILIKDKFVYHPFQAGTEPMDVIIALQNNASVTRHNPRLYITCDGTSIIAYDPKDDDLYDGSLNTLWRDFEFFKPLAGIEKFRNYEEAEADVKTAELMAKLYDDICRYNDFRDPEVSHYINVFMSRLLFCFFAEDTGLFKDSQFTKAIEDNTAIDGSDLAEFIDRLFVIMSTDNKELRKQQTNIIIADFPYVNGGLFLQRYPIPVLSRQARKLILKCGSFQWSEINPDIFGSMTQAIVKPEDRAELGIHYTSVPNIMKVIQPLFLDDLAADFLRCRNDAKALNALLVRMSKIKFFDPACGSGNFLIITYKRIRELEIEIWKRLFELQKTTIPFSDIALTQFYGIELDEYACETATLSLWLAEHQMNNKFREEFGTSPSPLPLRPSGHIICSNACTTNWETICPHENDDDEIYVMGNPPYLGTRNQENWHKSDMNVTFGNVPHGMLDYIGCWFYNGACYMRNHRNTKCAFVSTNSITQGVQVQMMWNPIFRMGMEIQFAHKSFLWSNNAKNNAGVSVVVIGFGNQINSTKKYIYDGEEKITVGCISPTLSEQSFVGVSPATSSIAGMRPILKGSLPADENYLTLYPSDKQALLEKYPELDLYIKPFVGSLEYIRGEERYCLWIPDEFASKAYQIPELAFRFEKVKEMRLKSKKAATQRLASIPYKFAEDRFDPSPSLMLPVVSSERREYIPIGFVNPNTVVYYSSFAVYNADFVDFAILTSKMHNVWAKATSGKLENRIRYSATLCYNTFPSPRLSNKQREELELKAKEILLVRAEHTEMTLGDMYNPESFPEDLCAAHHILDLAVERCYREKPFESDEERLDFLFKQYVKLTTR